MHLFKTNFLILLAFSQALIFQPQEKQNIRSEKIKQERSEHAKAKRRKIIKYTYKGLISAATAYVVSQWANSFYRTFITGENFVNDPHACPARRACIYAKGKYHDKMYAIEGFTLWGTLIRDAKEICFFLPRQLYDPQNLHPDIKQEIERCHQLYPHLPIKIRNAGLGQQSVLYYNPVFPTG